MPTESGDPNPSRISQTLSPKYYPLPTNPLLRSALGFLLQDTFLKFLRPLPLLDSFYPTLTAYLVTTTMVASSPIYLSKTHTACSGVHMHAHVLLLVSRISVGLKVNKTYVMADPSIIIFNQLLHG
jgi:hypothetical protein